MQKKALNTERLGKSSMTAILDKILLLGAASLTIATFGTVFLLGEIYHVNPIWSFCAINSIVLALIIGKDLKGKFKNRKFLLFFTMWMIVHGVVVVALMRWFSIVYWPGFLALELFIGFGISYWVFGVLPERRKPKDGNSGKDGTFSDISH